MIDRIHILPAPPRGWYKDRQGMDGARYTCPSRKLRVIYSGQILEGKGWIHLSLSHAARIPTWGELRSVKDLFLGDVYAYLVFPTKEFYVSIHPHVLHLFHCLDGPQLPEFSGVLRDGRRGL